MIFTKTNKKLRDVAFAVLLLQTIALLFCGDSDCLLGESDEICQTPLCTVLDNHDHSQPPFDSNQADSCPCACNLCYNIPEIRSFADTFVETYFLIEPRLFLSIPTSRIDHIPRA